MVYYDGQVLTHQLAYGMLGHWLIRRIKTSRLVPFINEQTYWMNRALAVVLAMLSAVGINYQYAYTADGVLTLTLTGLTLASIWDHFLQTVVAYGSQQLPYHLTKSSGDQGRT